MSDDEVGGGLPGVELGALGDADADGERASEPLEYQA
jgi:hypothetical protein